MPREGFHERTRFNVPQPNRRVDATTYECFSIRTKCNAIDRTARRERVKAFTRGSIP